MCFGLCWRLYSEIIESLKHYPNVASVYEVSYGRIKELDLELLKITKEFEGFKGSRARPLSFMRANAVAERRYHAEVG